MTSACRLAKRDTLSFCETAVTQARVGVAPGVAFGAHSETLIYLCYAKSPELVEKALNQLAGLLRS